MKLNAFLTRAALEANTPRILALGLLAVIVLVSLAGCNGPTRASGDGDFAGTYTLATVDGKNLPAALAHEGTTMMVKSGILTINADGSCTSLVTFSVPPHNDINREVKASYVRNGAELTLRWTGAGTTRGVIEGDTFTMTNEGMVFAYRK